MIQNTKCKMQMIIGMHRGNKEDIHNINNIVLGKSFGRIVAFRKAVLLSG